METSGQQSRRDQEPDLVAAAAVDARASLEVMLGFVPGFVIAIDLHGRIEFINKVLPQYAKADVIGSNWLNYFHADQQPRMQASYASVLATGAAETFEVSFHGPDGSTTWFFTQMAAVHSRGQIVGAVLVTQDITEQKRVQVELVDSRRLALLGTLAAGVAHEINTPVQFVGDSVRFLRDAGQDLLVLVDTLQELRNSALKGADLATVVAAANQAEELADLPYIRENLPSAFERCLDGLGRVAAIVQSLKEFAHPPSKEMAAVDLNHAIKSTLTITGSEYRYVADVVTDFGPIPPVVCHVGEINQVIMNVVVNAAHAIGDVVKGTETKGLITVSTRLDGDQVVIAISDTGSGIPEAARPRIFDPFFTTKEVGKGTGQGLPISLSIIKKQHGGDLTFQTELGKGTTFFIRLPIHGRVRSPISVV